MSKGLNVNKQQSCAITNKTHDSVCWDSFVDILLRMHRYAYFYAYLKFDINSVRHSQIPVRLKILQNREPLRLF